jgi:hypothetical protein
MADNRQRREENREGEGGEKEGEKELAKSLFQWLWQRQQIAALTKRKRNELQQQNCKDSICPSVPWLCALSHLVHHCRMYQET